MSDTQPMLDGYHAGLRYESPLACPYEKLTKEWREWQMWHGWGVERRRAHEAFMASDGQGVGK